ncbi:hypothetical protein sscle_08g068410 [Sclerotinia sclerotiorum 1980 UF-70]|uniref:Choline kinase N-terminal domain-containing protein n=2 Tax=Sclerotinia sclerotiorum (strain ATCC 18683 / 1980 / Ss-1) TaxID=665079 RepID=A0A1D9QAW7_SCLS1|nr:hypothetical protein sscle_08g068410 [Sclerotinia sclerotiorum 1980 UF-70]
MRGNWELLRSWSRNHIHLIQHSSTTASFIKMNSPPDPNSATVPRRPALRTDSEDLNSPKSGPTKVVSIAEPEPEDVQKFELPPSDESSKTKHFSAGVAKRMTGRPNMPSATSSKLSIRSQTSFEEPIRETRTSDFSKPTDDSKHHHHRDKLLSQVAEWLHAEKAKRATRESNKRGTKENEAEVEDLSGRGTSSKPRSMSSSSSSSALSLEKLQKILEDNMLDLGHSHLPHLTPPRRVSRKRSLVRPSLKPTPSSDTEYHDEDIVVPSCDVILDNSKTLAYSGGAGSSMETTTLSNSKRAEKERKAWIQFKNEIVRLAHTLRLKGWRRVPLDRGAEIEVERLSGALTNAVYVVSPPANLPPSASSTNLSTKSQRYPSKLLLRIYGPQVEHLIDREAELSILRRLARKKIGPRMLGTFRNGRFEEFFNAQTLTAQDLRIPDTSKKIAKRMRELHDGVALLQEERDQGPFVWRNWDKWVDRCEKIITYLDRQILDGDSSRSIRGESWRDRGLVCGVEWPVFRAAVERYRQWLEKYYGGSEELSRSLVFAHNDTQYGNILRLVPELPVDGSAPSPLLLPMNHHKQLVVIDFEYASANTRGLEFANHFTEWCYNYHAPPPMTWTCDTRNYPTIEEQKRFIRAYINHRPHFNLHAYSTPKFEGRDAPAGSIKEFMLDSRTLASERDMPSSSTNLYAEEEARREEETEKQVEEMLREVRMWRLANSAQWVAWGIVQAKVPELDDAPPFVVTPDEIDGPQNGILEDAKMDDKMERENEREIKVKEQVEEEEDEFDYLGYAQSRALFFWGDVVALGILGIDELPVELADRIKILNY